MVRAVILAAVAVAGCARDGVVILRRFEPYGPPTSPPRQHLAVDIAAEAGDFVIASADGITALVGFQPASGHLVIVRHPDRQTIYVGLRSVAVKTGQPVSRGQPLGEVGYPAEPELGTHVHWAMRDAHGRPIDPLAGGVDCITKVNERDRARFVYPVRC
jgi:murein DD-endopeptidase MepM/ murein hydrolase activator NlpD